MRIRGPISVLAIAFAFMVLGGCQRALFPPDTPRTQYEKSDRMRNRYAPLEEPDEFGNPRPALRARLSQAK